MWANARMRIRYIVLKTRQRKYYTTSSIVIAYMTLKSFNSNFLFLKFFHNSFIFQNKFTVNWISKMLESQVGKRNLLSELTGVILKCSECDDNCEWIKLWRFDFLFFEIHLVLTKKFKIKCWSLYFTNQRFYKSYIFSVLFRMGKIILF